MLADRGATPRELLVKAAGVEHEMHSVVGKARSKSTITIQCSCGEIFAIANTPEHLHVLRNVEMHIR